MIDLDALANDLRDAGWSDIEADHDEGLMIAYRFKGHIHQVELTIWMEIPSVSIRADGENDIPLETFAIITRHRMAAQS